MKLERINKIKVTAPSILIPPQQTLEEELRRFDNEMDTPMTRYAIQRIVDYYNDIEEINGGFEYVHNVLIFNENGTYNILQEIKRRL